MTVVFLLVPETLNRLLHLLAQGQRMGLPPGMIQLIEQAECFPPLLPLHLLLQAFVVDAIAVPGFAQAVAELAAGSLTFEFERLERGQRCVEIAGSKLFQGTILQLFAPLAEALTILLALCCRANL